MKILSVSPYVTKNSISLLAQCKSGFGYMVYDIAKSLAKTEHMDMLLTNYRYDSFSADGIFFIKSNIGLFIKNLFLCSSIILPFKLLVRFKPSLRLFIRIFYFWFISGYYKAVIKNGKYDIVHVHGCGFYEEFIINICKKLDQKFVITLHGLDSFSESVVLEPAGKKYERYLLKRVAEGDFPITVISTGIKKILLNEYGLGSCDNVYIVCNSFSFSAHSNVSQVNIRSIYGLRESTYIVLYVGNLCNRKNQKQIVDSFYHLKDDLRESTYVLFLGRDIEPDYKLKEYIALSKFANHFILCGNIDKENVHFYYEQGDAVALLSISEGFGLSLIEGMHFGKPCITFNDLDAFEDIYSKDAVVGLSDRNDVTVAKGIEQLLTRKWDKAAIMNFSKKFEDEAMATNYIKTYQQIVTQ